MTKKEETLFDGVKRVGAEYLARRLVKAAGLDDLPEAERSMLTKGAARDIQNAIDIVRQRLRKVASAPPLDPVQYTAQWTKVLAACRVLQIPSPKKGTAIDLEPGSKAYRNRRAQVRAYHPDANPGRENEVATEMAAVNNAWETLEQYNASLKAPLRDEPPTKGAVS